MALGGPAAVLPSSYSGTGPSTLTFALTPVWVLDKAGTVLQLWSGAITLFLSAKALAEHMAAFLTLKQREM